jgi:hypothetical protein
MQINDRDYRENPEKYEEYRFSVGQILFLGDLLKPEIKSGGLN